MLTYPISHGSLSFHIPAPTTNDIAAWVLLSDEVYMQDQINRSGTTTAIRLEGKLGFHHLAELPKKAGTAIPYYGMVGGAYHFTFTVVGKDTSLRVEHFAGNRLNLKPFETDLGTQPQIESRTEATEHWFGNRLEYLIEKRKQDYHFHIDGEMYANLLAIGWQKDFIHNYRYEFVPLSVGCRIIIQNISSTQTFDLTENVDW